MIIAKADEPIPNAVLYNASEIPIDNCLAASPPPDSPRLLNARIIPITVPSNPINVDTDAKVERKTKFFSSIGNSSEVASSTSF